MPLPRSLVDTGVYFDRQERSKHLAHRAGACLVCLCGCLLGCDGPHSSWQKLLLLVFVCSWRGDVCSLVQEICEPRRDCAREAPEGERGSVTLTLVDNPSLCLESSSRGRAARFRQCAVESRGVCWLHSLLGSCEHAYITDK